MGCLARCIVILLLCSTELLFLGSTAPARKSNALYERNRYYTYEYHVIEDDRIIASIEHDPMTNTTQALYDAIGKSGMEAGDAAYNNVWKREIFGNDDRAQVDISTSSRQNNQLVKATVLISIGCTGTLISPNHVLTAAHCVNSDGKFKTGASAMEVGIERYYGLEWQPVTAIFLPSNWTKPEANVDPDYYDYAVLKIGSSAIDMTSLPVTLATEKEHGIGSALMIVSYDDDKPGKTKWYTTCKVKDINAGILWHTCDVTYGASGAGMYALHFERSKNKWVSRTVGVLSGYNYDENMGEGLNYAVRINLINYFYICSWSCQSEKCLSELTEDDKRNALNHNLGWVIDKLNSYRPKFCANN